MEDHTHSADYIDKNIFKKNLSNLRDNMEWININSKGKDFFLNLYANSPKLYREFIEALDDFQAKDGVNFFPDSVILCPVNKDDLKRFLGNKLIENSLV